MTRPARRVSSAGHASTGRPRGIKGGPRPFRRVLVANRGEIALRILRACRELGVDTVAVYSDADRRARHVRAADQAVWIGPAPAAESYLCGERIVAAALETGAEAIHPGYGFLSEQAPFAEACVAAGLTFVGPEARTLAGLGDKLAARRAAAAVGVPVVPGTLEPVRGGDAEALAALTEAAERIGWPLLVKAAAGGGGRGMRRVDRPADLADALSVASHEAAAAFGDGTVYLERLIEGARHVEVQLLGDASGQVVAIGERDCSIQRRHQKLVEEAPAPGLDAERRSSLHGHAVEVAKAVGLRNAATAEFLMEPNGSFWFLEVNARLQVEHGVTELTTGLDLVREQLWIAAGRPLSAAVLAAAASAVRPAGHAIEVRLSAEDPALAFAPTPGTVTAWREPGGPGVRVDTWIEPGTRIGSDYDPLLAKILVVAEDRPAAVARLRRALDELEVGGLQTTLPFDRWLLEQPSFLAAELATDFVDRYWVPGPIQAAAARAAALLAVAAEREGSVIEGFAGAAPHAEGGWQDPNGSLTDPSSQGSGGRWPGAPDGGSAWRAAARRDAVRGLPR
jgi:acetyl-CoA carboxylase, biotin carboxylase subunit